LTGAGFCTYQRSSAVGPGLPDFFGTTYQNWKDAPKGSQNIPTGNKMFIRNGSKIDKMAPKTHGTSMDDFENIFAEKIANKLAFLTQNTDKLCETWIITLNIIL
jgi:hypothetical protein